MINTHQTSAFPPKVPPRPWQHDPKVAPRRGPSRAVVRLLGVVVVLHLLLSFGGFYYLYADRMTSPLQSANPKSDGQTSARISGQHSEKASHTAMASMTVKRPLSNSMGRTAREYLQWNMDHSIRRNVDYYWASWLKVQQPGDYYVYARVTFSTGGGPDGSLVSMIRLKRNEEDEPRDVMKAYCSLGRHNTGQCTASQGQVLHLQRGNLLSVWVENHTWVDYERGATTFGMYKL